MPIFRSPSSGRRRHNTTAAAIIVCLASLSIGSAAAAAPVKNQDVDDVGTATIQNFIQPDPLHGNDGLPTSPAVSESFGGINLVLDVDGNAIEATRENDVRFYEGSYYLYGTSTACGSFDYSPTVHMTPLSPTNPASRYRYCGVTIYKSDDLMNWKLVSRVLPQDPATGKVFAVKKPRVLYSDATDSYVMWVHDKGSEGDGTPRVKIMTSKSPAGPWTSPTNPTHTMDVNENLMFPDFSMNEGPNGETWMVTSHGSFTGVPGAINVWKMTPELTGVESQTIVSIGKDDIFGGIGISYQDGWWYITGTTACGNCIGAQYSYVMARHPQGPWISPETGATEQPLTAEILSKTSAWSQPVGVNMLPDGEGGTRTLGTFSRYRSSPTAAPGTEPTQSGDNNFAHSGLFLYPLSYREDGRILPLDIKSSYTFPIVNEPGAVPDPYQAHLAVTAESSITQRWTLDEGSRVAAIFPSVFQRTPDYSVGHFPFTRRANAPIQDPLVNAPLDAELTLPDGQTYTWQIDPREVAWSPHVVPLNLPKTSKQSGEYTLTLSTSATNGRYGVATGPNNLREGRYSVTSSGNEELYPDAAMYLRTSAQRAHAPKIRQQPESVTAPVGATVGFVVGTVGSGLGYQWQRDGEDVPSPNGLSEANAPALRLQDITEADAGTYQVVVFNAAGETVSKKVTLRVVAGN